jgi:flagellar hook-length control protein FliK
MNIADSKLASVLQGGASTEGRGQSLIDNGSSPGSFADALKGRMESLGEVKAPGELPAQHETLVESRPVNPLPGQAEFLGPPVEQQFARLAGNAFDGKREDLDAAMPAAMGVTFPPQNSQTGKAAEPPTQEINEGKSGESSLSASLPETMALLQKPQQLEQVKDFNMTHSESNEDIAVISNSQMPLTDIAEESRQKTGETVVTQAHTTRDDKKASHSDSESETENPDLALLVINPFPPALPAAEEKVGVNHLANETGHKNAPPSFINRPLSEEFKSAAPGTTEGSEDDPQKNLVFGQIIKEQQDVDKSRSERSLLDEKMESGNVKSPLAEMDKSLPHEIADIAQVKGPTVENRVEIPAMSKPLAHPDWNKELGERIVWMHAKDLSAAEIKLNPQHLGPVSIRIEINDDQATIAFTAQHAAVRDALEASIPKLREMMSNQQINLADVNISQNSSSNQQHQSSSQQSSRNFEGFARMSGSEFETSEAVENINVTVSKGILSLYA